MELPFPTKFEKELELESRRGALRSIFDQANEGKPEKEWSWDRRDCLRELGKWEEKEKTGSLTPAEVMDLSACYIRLGRDNKAIALLEKTLPNLIPEEPQRFLLLSNLAAAYWAKGVASRAINYQREALAKWPVHFPGWTWEEWHRTLRAERALLVLMQSRPWVDGGRAPDPKEKTVDPLFPGVRFAGPGNKYIVGGLEPLSASRLPPDAEAILIQLMLWQPLDSDLYWQYAEVLNAKGKIHDAAKVMRQLVELSGYGNIPEVRQHRNLLVEATDATPRPPEDKSSERPAAPAPAVFDWRPLLVGLAGGVLIAVLIQLQWREWRRRRAQAAALAATPRVDLSRAPVASATEKHVAGGRDEGMHRAGG